MLFTVSPIGIIRTPFTTREGMPIQPTGATDVEGSVILDKNYEAGLKDLDGFSHIFLLYHFHRSSGFELSVKPFLDTATRGLFATRAPRRPNPIGLSIVKLLKIDGNVLTVRGIDVLDQTPLIDIKPWVPAFDIHDNARAGWMEKRQNAAKGIKADRRFVRDGH